MNIKKTEHTTSFGNTSIHLNLRTNNEVDPKNSWYSLDIEVYPRSDTDLVTKITVNTVSREDIEALAYNLSLLADVMF